MSTFTETIVEQVARAWFEALGYAVIAGPSIGPGEPAEERETFADVVLDGRLRDALARLNPTVSREGLDEAFRKLTRISSAQLVDANHELHHYLVNGVSVEYLRADGTIGYDPVRVVDFDVLENNDWLVVNQLTVTEGGHNRRPDVVVFLNGLPIAVFELKNAASENATMRAAQKRGEELGLSSDELAFYDALEVNDSAVEVLGDETLRTIARALVDTVKQNVTIDWTVKESVRAKLRVIVKRILRKHGYPPDKQEAATNTVLQQAELLSDLWAKAHAT